MQWDYSDRAKFEVVAFGCHKRASDLLREFFDRHGVVTFQFVEYFFLHPVTRNQPLGHAKTTLCFFPFLRRLLRESQFIPTVAERGRASLTPVTEELLERFERSEETGQPRRWVIPISASEVGIKLLTNWHRRSSTDDPFPCIARYATQDEWRRYEESLKK